MNSITARAHRVHHMPFGTELRQGQTRFRIWAPAQPAVSIVLEGQTPIAMQSIGHGWFKAVVDAQAGTR